MIEIPTWCEVAEKKEAIESSTRTIEESVIHGPSLDPLELFIYEQEPAGEQGEQFRKQLAELLGFISVEFK